MSRPRWVEPSAFLPDATSPAAELSPVRTVGTTVVATSLGILPPFLLGGAAVVVRADLGFGEAGLGALIALCFAVSAIASVGAGRLAERIGASRGMFLGSALSSACLLGAGLLVETWRGLAVVMSLAGLANALVQVAGNLAIARGVPDARLGLAFGVKQAAVPLATLVVGGFVPIVVVPHGWRPVFALAAVGVVFFTLLAHPGLHRSHGPVPAIAAVLGAADTATMPLVILAIGGGFGIAAANATGIFLVEFGVTVGLTVGSAGALLAVASVLGVVTRVVVGWYVDRTDTSVLGFVAAQLAGGGVGYVLLAATDAGGWMLYLGTTLVFVGGWGWIGLFNLAVTRLNGNAPAAAAGIVFVGFHVGGVLGPLGFGVAVEQLSYAVAWSGAAASGVLAGMFVVLGRRLAGGSDGWAAKAAGREGAAWA